MKAPWLIWSRGWRQETPRPRAELLYSQAVVYEHMLDFSSALRALETYETEFGATPEIRKEIAFLKTR